MTTLTVTRGPASGERRFYTGVALAVLAVVAVGFAPSFYLRPLFPDKVVPPEPIFVVHGIAFSAWIVLLITQASLVAAGRTDLHRRLGVAGALLAVAMVVLGTLGAVVAAARPTGFIDVPVPGLAFLAIPLFDMVTFAAFVALGIAQRRNAQAHKRFMLLATFALTTAAVARLPGVLPLGPLVFFGLNDLFIVALALWDFRTRGRLHPVTLWGGAALIASQALRLAVMGTAAWQAFARWLVGVLV